MPDASRAIDRRALLLAAGALLTVAAAAPARAQSYPNKPVRLVVPYPAGGGTDFFARSVGAKLGELLGQTVVVDNRPGAATIIGADAVAKSPPDGYTALVADSTTIAVNPSLYRKLPYDVAKDFAPVTLTARFAMLLVVNPTVSKAATVKEFVDEAKKAGGQMSYGSVGAGTTHHLAMEMFQQRAGITLSHVPYKGAAPAVQDLLGGQIPAMFLDLASGAQHIKSGKLKALGVASARRIAPLPDVPTIAEAGVPQFEVWAWQGLVMPAGTPKDAIDRLNRDYARAIADPALKQKLLDAGIEPITSTPEEMNSYVRSETAKWAQVIRQGNIRVE